MNDTFDNKKVIKPVGLMDIDSAFLDWWDKTLNIHLTNQDGSKKKVPVRFVSPERWKTAREEELRDANGTLINPILAITRTETSSVYDSGTGRFFADTQDQYTFHKEIDKKSSLIKNLINERGSEGINPSFPIYEVYTHPVPDHYSITYEVSIRTSYIAHMNSIIEKIGQQMNFKSQKSFQFVTPDGYYFLAFQDDVLADESNVAEFTGTERIIEKTYTFQVPGYVIGESDERRSQFRRYFSQTKLVVRGETILSADEVEELFKK